MNKKLLSLYGLKWNPFSANLPIEALFITPPVEHLCWRVEQTLLGEGGFALISGDPGTGKSVTLRVLSDRLSKLRDINVATIAHPSSSIADFYREMGDIFGVELRPHNRWGGFKSLRERWVAHLEATSMRAVLLIDEAQEMSPTVLNELRLLSSTDFDSKNLLSIILAGDARLNNKLRKDELIPLGSRIRVRRVMDYADREELLACLTHLVSSAGNANLMSPELMQTLCEHAAGNYRAMSIMAAELLGVAAREELTTLDEKLYLRVYGPTSDKKRRTP
jgi:type II secretory pathway predicted ATPase ExeA